MSSRNSVAEFNYYLDTATSPEKTKAAPAGHFPINKICWLIDEGFIQPEDAIQAIHGKIVEENSEIVLLALEVLNAVFYKCGSLAHKVICTEFYMGLLKEIIQTTDNRKIKETILHMLQEWAENFKYFPQYSAPQKLLQELKEDEVPKSTKEGESRETNGIHQAFKQTTDLSNLLKNTEKVDKNRLNESNLDLIKAASNESNSYNQTDAEFQEREEDFKKALKEYQQKRKLDYNNYRKTLGLPPLSSDEEDNDDNKGARNHKLKQEEACTSLKSSCSLPKELQRVKDQRERLNSEIHQFREHKHNSYMQSSNSVSKEIEQCKDKNCKKCKTYKKKDDTEEYRLTQRFPYEIRKIIESKQRLNKSIEEIKKSKQEDYYNKKKSMSSFSSHNKMEIDDYELKDSDSEDERLQRAILLSKTENVPKSTTAEPKQTNDALKNVPSLEEIDESKYFEQVLAASRLDTGGAKMNSMTAEQERLNNGVKNTPSSTEIDEERILQQVIARTRLNPETEEIDETELLQRAINKSFAEEEEKNFTPMPKTNEEVLIEYVKQMSLKETHKSQSNNEESTSNVEELRLCLICYEVTILKQFIPCNHKCVCYNCAEKLKRERCVICNKRYTSLV